MIFGSCDLLHGDCGVYLSEFCIGAPSLVQVTRGCGAPSAGHSSSSERVPLVRKAVRPTVMFTFFWAVSRGFCFCLTIMGLLERLSDTRSDALGCLSVIRARDTDRMAVKQT